MSSNQLNAYTFECRRSNLTSPKSGKARSVPLASDVAKALAKLSERELFTSEDDLVFVGATMRYLHYAPRAEDARLVAEAFSLETALSRRRTRKRSRDESRSAPVMPPAQSGRRHCGRMRALFFPVERELVDRSSSRSLCTLPGNGIAANQRVFRSPRETHYAKPCRKACPHNDLIRCRKPSGACRGPSTRHPDLPSWRGAHPSAPYR